MAEKKEKKEKSKVRKIIEWIITGLFLAVIATVGTFKVIQLTSKDNFILGKQYPIVLTDSMEPDLMVNDVLIIEKVQPQDIKEGDYISFYYDIFNNGKLYSVTHMISFIEYFPDTSENDGYSYLFTAHGINKHSSQCGGGDCTFQRQLFNESALIGKVTGKSPFLTFFNKMLSSYLTLIFIILIPSFYLTASAIVDLIRVNDEDNMKEVTEIELKNNPLAGLSQDEIEKLKNQMLDEMLKKKKEK